MAASEDPRPPSRGPAPGATAADGRWQGRRAGLVSRLLADIVDFVVVVVLLAVGYAAVSAVRFLWDTRTFSFPSAPFGLMLVLGGVLTTVYLSCCWFLTGRTYGDHLLGLRVVGRRTRQLRLGGALSRAVLCVLFPVGLFWVAVSRDNRSLQDVVLRTAVIYDWGASRPPR